MVREDRETARNLPATRAPHRVQPVLRRRRRDRGQLRHLVPERIRCVLAPLAREVVLTARARRWPEIFEPIHLLGRQKVPSMPLVARLPARLPPRRLLRGTLRGARRIARRWTRGVLRGPTQPASQLRHLGAQLRDHPCRLSERPCLLGDQGLQLMDAAVLGVVGRDLSTTISAQEKASSRLRPERLRCRMRSSHGFRRMGRSTKSLPTSRSGWPRSSGGASLTTGTCASPPKASSWDRC